MSNIKTIVVNNETYNIEDAVARNLLSNVYNKEEINARLVQIETNKNDISALKGTGTGSIDAMINDKINAWATQLTNDGTVNTYAEAIQWIADHGSEYTALLGDVSNKVDKVSGKGLSTNDLTDTLKNNYNTAYTHSQSAHAPSTAQANVIEIVKVNGIALTPSSKAVDITVPNYTFQVKEDGHLYVTY